MHAAHPHDPAGVDHQSSDFRVPQEREIRIAQTLTVKWADQAHTAPLGNVLAAYAVSRYYLRKQVPTDQAKVVQPIVNFAPRILRVKADPAIIGVFAESDKIPAGQFHRIHDAARLLFGCIHHADHPARHHRVSAEDGSHVNDRNVGAGAGSFQPGAETGDARADNDYIRLR